MFIRSFTEDYHHENIVSETFKRFFRNHQSLFNVHDTIPYNKYEQKSGLDQTMLLLKFEKKGQYL